MTSDLLLGETARPERLVTEAGRSSFKTATLDPHYAAATGPADGRTRMSAASRQARLGLDREKL